jgi:hypothetical protein
VPLLRGVLQAEGALAEVQVGWSAGQARGLRQAHLRAGVHYHASLTVVHPSGDLLQALVLQNLLILEVPLAVLGYQVLIGRDVLDHCDFFYGGRQQRFSLAY